MPEIRRSARLSILVLVALLLTAAYASAQQLDPSLYSGLRWRMIGPFRAGRVNAVSGVPDRNSCARCFVADGGLRIRAATRSQSLFRPALADDWSISRRPRQRGQRRPGTTRHLLFRFGGRRSVEVSQLRPHLESDL